MGPDGLKQLKKLASNVSIANKLGETADDEDVPNLVNFEEASMAEVQGTPQTKWDRHVFKYFQIEIKLTN